jgi:hypothetical protein
MRSVYGGNTDNRIHRPGYVCSNCNLYIPSANKRDWLQHKQDFHKIEFDELVEIQRMLTHACNMIRLDDNEVMSI